MGIHKDIRDAQPADLEGVDAVVRLAGLSNDPLGNLSPSVTYDINHLGTAHLAQVAREASVERFIFSSSCSNYGSADNALVDEEAALNPLTPYAISNVRAELDLAKLAGDSGGRLFIFEISAEPSSPLYRRRVQRFTIRPFNVVWPEENYRIQDLAEMVREVVPKRHIEFAADASPDTRSYRVDASKIQRHMPNFAPGWTARKGVEKLH